MNIGSLFQGGLDGLLYGLLAVGIVLVYRSSRFLNLAHGQLGALPAVLLAKLVLTEGLGYWPSLILCLAVGAGTGVLVERFLVAPLLAKTSSGVSPLLLTIGVAQLLAALMFIKWLQPDLAKYVSQGYPLPFHVKFVIGGVIFGGQYTAILIFCPILVIGLTVFLRYSVMGKMIRAAASNREAARLCGISPALVSAVTWGLAGALSTFSAVLASPSQTIAVGGTGSSSLGPDDLLLALGAAAFGAFTSVPWALVGGVVIGIASRITAIETSNAGDARLVVFILILVVILARGKAIGEAFATRGSAVDDRPPINIPAKVRNRPLVRYQRGGLIAAGLLLAVVAPLLPPLHSSGNRFELSLIAIFALIGVSLTILIGWGGQLSLGHFAVVGICAYVAGRLAGHHWSLVALLAFCGLLGAAVMVVIGLPALRVPGLTLAVTTLGLGVVGPEWLFHGQWFTGSVTSFVNVQQVMAPFRGFQPHGRLGVYWTCVVVLVAVALMAGAIRRSNPGRTMIAVRDSEPTSAAMAISPTTVKLTALAVSGCVVGMAGVLWADAWQSVSPDQFDPALSIAILAVPVIGGMGSVAGTVAASILFYFGTFFIAPHVSWIFGSVSSQEGFQLALGGLTLIGVLLAYPTGLAGFAQKSWERYLLRIDQYLERRAPKEAPVGPILTATEVEVHFGGIRALQGATIELRRGEILGLIGPNGAGKSTLLNVISGIQHQDHGKIMLDGRDVSTLPTEIRASLGMSRSFQAATLFPGLTVSETVRTALGARTRISLLSSAIGAPWARRAERRLSAQANALIERMGLSAWSNSLTSELSTGTRRICDLTVQVARGSKVLLLDEPTGGVAQREAEAFGPVLRRIREELDCSIVIVEHDMPLLMGLCDRVYAMVEGRVVAEGTPAQIRHDPQVVASYLGTDARAIDRSGRQRPMEAPHPRPQRRPRAPAAKTPAKTATKRDSNGHREAFDSDPTKELTVVNGEGRVNGTNRRSPARSGTSGKKPPRARS